MNRISISARLSLVGGLLLLGSVAHATWYTSEGDFVAALDPTYYLEDFNGWTVGNPLAGQVNTYSAPGGNGYGWTANATLGLWSDVASLSTNLAQDPITFTFAGNPVSAFGGIVANVDINANPIHGTVTMTLSNTESQTVTLVDGQESFLGWVGTGPISSANVVSAGDAGTFTWGQIGHIYAGAAAPVPEPASIAVVGLGVAALLRRRRLTKR